MKFNNGMTPFLGRRRTALPGSRTPKAEALTDLILEVFRFRGELERHGRKIVQPFEQTPTRWLVLGAIGERPRTIPQIARRMGVTRQGVQRVADGIVSEGLAECVDNPDHRRSPILTLTARGRRILTRINGAQAGWSNKVAETFTLEDLRNAVRTIEAVTNHLKATV